MKDGDYSIFDKETLEIDEVFLGIRMGLEC